MKLMPIGQTAAQTKYSSLSRNEIARLFSELGESKVYPSTIAKICTLLKYEAKIPIPLGDVQRLYLVACAKELINGGRASYSEAVLTFCLSRDDSDQSLLEAWNAINAMGGMSKNEFDLKLKEFYMKTQLDKRATF